jgi:hypothetical protein
LRRLKVPESGGPLILPKIDNWLTKWLLKEFRPKGKSENRRVFIGDLMAGLGGLEPPTSPLSGAFMVLYA